MKHPYALHGCVWCGLCGRRMQGQWANDAAYYRCRPPAGYDPAGQVQHPLSVYLREDRVIGEVEQWLARELAPHRTSQVIRALEGAGPRGGRAENQPPASGTGKARHQVRLR